MDRIYSEKIRVGIFGTWGFGNMGDAAVADATVDGLKRYFPNAEIVAICQQPENRVMRHEIRSISIYRTYLENTELVHADGESDAETARELPSPKQKVIALIKAIKPIYLMAKGVQRGLQLMLLLPKELRFTLEIFRTLHQFQLLVMAGSGQLNEEWGGPWRYPFGLFRWTLLARISGCKIAFLSVGVGEITTFWGKFFCSTAVRLAHYRSSRDTRSKEILENWGIESVQLVPDMAFAIDFDVIGLSENRDDSMTVAINPISYCDPRTWFMPDQDKYDKYVEKLARFSDWLITTGHRVVFVPNDLLMDRLTIDDIVRGMDPCHRDSPDIIRPDVDNYVDVFRNLAMCDCVVCCRFHGLLFSLLADKPVIALAHHHKFFKLTEEMGQGKYCLDIESFSLNELKTLFAEAAENRRAIGEEIKNHRKDYAEQVEKQYRKMTELVGR